MKELAARVTAHPVVRHVMATNERFNTRLGNQSAAAIAYFSVLAMVPVLMFTFTIIAMTLTVLRPDLLLALHHQVDVSLSSDSFRGTVKSVVMDALQNWRAVGIVALGSGMWIGAGWANNIKRAIRAQMRDDYDAGDTPKSFVRETITNIGIGAVLLVAIGLTLGLSSGATWLSTLVSEWLELDSVSRRVMLSAAGIAGSLVAGFGLFMFLLGVLPERSYPRRIVMQGAVIGSVGVAALQYLASVIVGAFSKNAAAAIFGPVVIIMLFLNLFATLVLMIAAWIATAEPTLPAAPDAASSATVSEDSDPPAAATAPAVRRGFRLGTVVGAGIVLFVSAAMMGAASAVRRLRAGAGRER